MLIHSYIEKAISIINIAIEWLRVKGYNGYADLPTTENTLDSAKLYWTGKLVDFVELISALYEAKIFNKGSIKKKTLIKSLCVFFNVKISDFNVHYSNIKNRSDRTKFLNELMALLESKMDSDEEKIANRYKGLGN